MVGIECHTAFTSVLNQNLKLHLLTGCDRFLIFPLLKQHYLVLLSFDKYQNTDKISSYYVQQIGLYYYYYVYNQIIDWEYDIIISSFQVICL